MARILDRLVFRIERLMVRGAQYRLLVIAAAIGAISIFGGALVLWAGTGFGNFGEATWWAFLRLTDPGYLGDDVGTMNRVTSTILTVLGYVVFLGALGESESEVIISPLIVSHILAQVALRRELQAVFEELFTAGGADITFRPATDYAAARDDVAFSTLEAAAHARGHTLLGLRSRARPADLVLAPDRAARHTVTAELELVVLA